MLNDKCLLTLFGYLNLSDLCQVAHVNKRLNAWVKSDIQTKYHVRFSANFDLTPYKGRINVAVAKAFFHIFGNEIAELKLARNSFDGTFDDYQSMFQIFGSLQQHCNNIKKFTLQGFGTCGLNCTIFKELEELTLVKCSVSRDWDKMNKLKTLRLSEVVFRRWPLQRRSSYDDEIYRELTRGLYFYEEPTPISIPVDCFGKLTVVQLSDVNFERGDLEKLLQKNRKIKILSIVKCTESSPVIFNALPYLKKLEEFEYKKKQRSAAYYSYAFHHLYALKNLKTLKMTFHNVPAPEIFEGFTKNGVHIKHLEIHGGRFNDGTAADISKMQLTTLKLYNVADLSEAHILSIVGELKRLDELHILTSSAFKAPGSLMKIVNAAHQLKCLNILVPKGSIVDESTFQAILTSLQNRNAANTLAITIYGDGEQSVSVPDEMLKGENEKWLKVTVANRSSILSSVLERALPR